MVAAMFIFVLGRWELRHAEVDGVDGIGDGGYGDVVWKALEFIF